MPRRSRARRALPAWTIAAAALHLGPGAAAAETGAPAERAWTFLIYAAADNNADDHFQSFLNDVRREVADDAAIELVVFIDRHAGYSNESATFGENFTGGRLYRMREKSAERLDGGAEFPECRLDAEWEPDSSDPTHLRQFLDFGQAHFAAPRTALLIYSHANGITLCPDEQSRGEMGIPEMAQVIGAEHSVDWVALELCNMGGIEIAYEWSVHGGGFSADVLTAIPNAGPPLDWKRIFGRVHSPGHPAAQGRSDVLDPARMDARDFGLLAIEEGLKGRQAAAARGGEEAARGAHEAAASYDLERVGAVKEAVDAFARAVAAGGGESRAALERLRDGDREKGIAPVMNYVGDRFVGEGAFVDLAALLARAAECKELGAAAQEAAKAALHATDECVLASFGMSGYPGFVNGRNGAFLHFPAGDRRGVGALGQRAFAASGWYSPLPHGDTHRRAVGTWAWCRDGANRGDGVVDNWFELLDAWYDHQDDGGVNGVSH
jgi:clostripain